MGTLRHRRCCCSAARARRLAFPPGIIESLNAGGHGQAREADCEPANRQSIVRVVSQAAFEVVDA